MSTATAVWNWQNFSMTIFWEAISMFTLLLLFFRNYFIEIFIFFVTIWKYTLIQVISDLLSFWNISVWFFIVNLKFHLSETASDMELRAAKYFIFFMKTKFWNFNQENKVIKNYIQILWFIIFLTDFQFSSDWNMRARHLFTCNGNVAGCVTVCVPWERADLI